MNKDTKQTLYDILAQSRDTGRNPNSALFESLQNISFKDFEELEKLIEPLKSINARNWYHYIFPSHLIQFIENLTGKFKGKNILIPFSDTGILAKYIESKNPKKLTAYANGEEHKQFLTTLLNNSTILKFDQRLESLSDDDSSYDLAIGNTPLGLKTPFDIKLNDVQIKNEVSEMLMALSLDKLSDGGMAAFITTPSLIFLKHRKHSLISNLNRIGYSLNAAIDLPAGMWSPVTHIPSLLVLISKQKQTKVFSGLYSNKDLNRQQQLIKNFKEGKDAKQAENGSWLDFDEFKGYKYVELNQRIERLARKAGLELVEFSDICKSIKSINIKKQSDFHVNNSIYFPKVGFGDTIISPEDFRKGLTNVIQVVLNESVNAQFLSEFLNSSNLGNAFRESIVSPGIMPYLSLPLLKASKINIPDINIQDKVIETHNKVKQFRAQISAIEHNLWEQPNKHKELESKLSQLNKDSFENWIDTLPFPLASILWSYKTQTNTTKEKYEKLIDFFEASTEFFAVLHLSAIYDNPELFEEVRGPLNEQLKKNNMRLEMATFGVWLTILEFLLKHIRKILNSKEGRSTVLNAYAMENFDLMNQFLSKEYIKTFKEANSIRNSDFGHTGAISEKKAGQVHKELRSLLSDFRLTSASVWSYYHIVIPVSSKYINGIHEYTVRNIMGTRTPFKKLTIESKSPLEDNKLHLYSDVTLKSIKILPFIKVIPSPKTEADACYFYNRMSDAKESRFISYHYEGDPETLLTSISINHVIDRLKQE